jgi:hypothetical protein
MSKFLVVYNFCGVRVNNLDLWINAIDTIINQRDSEFDLILSGCLIDNLSKLKIVEYLKFKNINCRVLINFIEELHPINVTFNHSCLIATRLNNKIYDGYLFMSSDILFKNDYDFKKMFKFHLDNNNGISNFIVDNENWIPKHIGLEFWNILKNEHADFPFGTTINCDCVIFDGEIYRTYNRVIPDIFRSWCTESVFPFLCSSINKKFKCHDNSFDVHHAINRREGSSTIAASGCEKGCDDLYRSSKNVFERLLTQEAFECGFGYAESHFNIHTWTREHKNKIYLIHNHNAYISDYVPKDRKRLENFIRVSIFLSEEELNYDQIKYNLLTF